MRANQTSGLAYGRDDGNALFLILIAVALFAGLSYVVTKTGRGSGTIGREQAELAISEMMQHGASIQSAILRMKLAGPALTDTPSGVL